MWAIFYTGYNFAEMELAAEKSTADYRKAANIIANCFGWLYVDVQADALSETGWTELYSVQAEAHSLWRTEVLGD